MTRNKFRLLVILNLIIGFGALLDLFFPALLSPEMRAHFAKAEASTYGVALAIYSLIATLLGFISVVGLLMFRRWARTLTLFLTCVSILSMPFFTEQISSGLSSAFSLLSSILSGAVIALMYVAPVSSYFSDKSPATG